MFARRRTQGEHNEISFAFAHPPVETTRQRIYKSCCDAKTPLEFRLLGRLWPTVRGVLRGYSSTTTGDLFALQVCTERKDAAQTRRNQRAGHTGYSRGGALALPPGLRTAGALVFLGVALSELRLQVPVRAAAHLLLQPVQVLRLRLLGPQLPLLPLLIEAVSAPETSPTSAILHSY